jgi:type VI secretion system secreted protein Hcp
MSSINVYLKLKLANAGLVKGPSTAPGHADEMVLDSFRWGESNSAALGSKGGHVTVREFEFTKKMCKASVLLLQGCSTRDTLVEAVIACRATGVSENVDFLKWTLKDGVISLYELEAIAKDSVLPTERVCIRFRTLAVDFKQRNPDGTLGTTMSAQLDIGAHAGSA